MKTIKERKRERDREREKERKKVYADENNLIECAFALVKLYVSFGCCIF